MSKRPVVCLMGPTASGKTDAAITLHEQLGGDIVSVDSAMVYRGMDIGTAKPDATTLANAPHRLVDIRDPEDSYSAGDFVDDACREIDEIHAAGALPVLAGGTMLYFRSLIHGIADMPSADPEVRKRIDEEAAAAGWPAMHERLAKIDPETAARLEPADSQRIQRALEVFEVSGKSLAWWHKNSTSAPPDYDFIKLALVPADRAALHKRIEKRFDQMLADGFADEVAALMRRPGLTADHASMRAVGYRQYWAALDGQIDMDTAREQALAATRQLAKRQLTWLRSESDLQTFEPLEKGVSGSISTFIANQMGK